MKDFKILQIKNHKISNLFTNKWLKLFTILPFLILFSPIILNFKSFPYDYWGYHMSHWAFQFKESNLFRIILFDPYTYSGSEYYKNFQSMQFYFPFAIYKGILKLFNIEFTFYKAQYINIFHYLLFYIGFYNYGRMKNCSRMLATIIATAAITAGPIISNAQHAGIICAVSWSLWLFIITDKYIATEKNKYLIYLFFINIAIITQGFIPILLQIYFIYSIYLFYILLIKKTNSALAIYSIFIISLISTTFYWLPFLIESQSNTIQPQGSTNPKYYLSLLYPYIYNYFDGDLNFDPTTTYFFTSLLIFGSISFKKNKLNIFMFLGIFSILLAVNFFQINNFIHSIPKVGVLYRPFYFEIFTVIFLLISCFRFINFNGVLINLNRIIINLFFIIIIATIYYKNLNLFFWLFVISNLILLLVIRFYQSTSHAKRFLFVLLIFPLLLWTYEIKNNRIFLGSSEKKGHAYDFENPQTQLFNYIKSLKDSNEKDFRVAIEQDKFQGIWNGLFRVINIESINGFETDISKEYHDFLTKDFANWSTDRLFGDFNPDSDKFKRLNIKYVITDETAKNKYQNSSAWKNVYKKDNLYIYEYNFFNNRFLINNKCGQSSLQFNKIASDDYEMYINLDKKNCDNISVFSSISGNWFFNEVNKKNSFKLRQLDYGYEITAMDSLHIKVKKNYNLLYLSSLISLFSIPLIIIVLFFNSSYFKRND